MRMESLEDRRVLATFTVTNTSDAGPGSLRDAIAQANANNNSPAVIDVIDFGPLFSTPQTILLTSGELSITESLVIEGPGAELLSIDASGNDATPLVKDGQGSRVLNIDDGTSNLISVTLAGATITGGDLGGFQLTPSGDRYLDESGGGILSYENLSILNAVIEDNAIVADLTADDPVPDYYSLSTRIEGGGVFFSGGFLNVSNSVIRNNLLLANYQGGDIGSSGLVEVYGVGVSTLTSANIEIDSSVISGNESQVNITNTQSLQLPDNDVRGMSIFVKGSGIYVPAFSQLTVSRSWLHDNSGSLVGDSVGIDGNDNTVAIEGVGIYSMSSSLIENSTISGNSGIYDLQFLPETRWLDMSLQGGGAWITNSTVINSTISGNSLMTSLEDDANFSTGSTFDNQIRSWGAGLYVAGNSRIAHTTIASNRLESETDYLTVAHAGAGVWSTGNNVRVLGR